MRHSTLFVATILQAAVFSWYMPTVATAIDTSFAQANAGADEISAAQYVAPARLRRAIPAQSPDRLLNCISVAEHETAVLTCPNNISSNNVIIDLTMFNYGM